MSTLKLPLTGLEVDSVTPAVLVCGDPARATRIAACLQDAALLNEQREYRAFRGRYQGVPVTVCSHGIGAPGAAIAFEELSAAGAAHIIRVGTCGGLQENVHRGHLVIAHAAVQYTGYARETVPEGYPAVADLDLTLALRTAAAAAPQPAHLGIVMSRDNFYAGVQTPYTPSYQTMAAANVLAVEMECAALFTVGSLRRVRTAAILAVDGNVLHTGESMATYDPHRQEVQQAVDAAIDVALRALVGTVETRHAAG
ncbi:MAG: nucleoside phosphorylase [Anaerolineales bacterium]|nr:nucleoside phosphorylase [Anaerolineales bacterium]